VESFESYDLRQSLDVYEHGQSSCTNEALNCRNYHYIRPLLRRIGAVGSSFVFRDFYTGYIPGVLDQDENNDIAISGTADYSWILPHSPLFSAHGSSKFISKLTVVDACPTPVKYATKVAQDYCIEVEASVSDIRKTLTDVPQNLILADALLTQFKKAKDRLAVLHVWAKTLRLGGFVLTTAQLRPPFLGTNELENFITNCIRLYEDSEYPDLIGVGPEDFAAQILNYTRTTNSRTYESEGELVNEIRTTGLKLYDMQPIRVFSRGVGKYLNYRGLLIGH
jgi:hypothetical protein